MSVPPRFDAAFFCALRADSIYRYRRASDDKTFYYKRACAADVIVNPWMRWRSARGFPWTRHLRSVNRTRSDVVNGDRQARRNPTSDKQPALNWRPYVCGDGAASVPFPLCTETYSYPILTPLSPKGHILVLGSRNQPPILNLSFPLLSLAYLPAPYPPFPFDGGLFSSIDTGLGFPSPEAVLG